jgi:hypothetical protein
MAPQNRTTFAWRLTSISDPTDRTVSQPPRSRMQCRVSGRVRREGLSRLSATERYGRHREDMSREEETWPDRTPAEQHVLNQIAGNRGLEFAKEHEHLIIQQARTVGYLPSDPEDDPHPDDLHDLGPKG